jgi:chromosome segregation ATPase
VSSERDAVSMQLEDLRVNVETERQAYQESKAENEIYSNQIKRLEMKVFEAEAAKREVVEKARAKKRALMSEKDNISSAYLKTTMRLAQAKEDQQLAQSAAATAKTDMKQYKDEVASLGQENEELKKRERKLVKKLKSANKLRQGAEEDMRLANQRAIEVEEVLAEKVRQLGERIFAGH